MNDGILSKEYFSLGNDRHINIKICLLILHSIYLKKRLLSPDSMLDKQIQLKVNYFVEKY